jgi:hypothetical protein
MGYFQLCSIRLFGFAQLLGPDRQRVVVDRTAAANLAARPVVCHAATSSGDAPEGAEATGDGTVDEAGVIEGVGAGAAVVSLTARARWLSRHPSPFTAWTGGRGPWDPNDPQCGVSASQRRA